MELALRSFIGLIVVALVIGHFAVDRSLCWLRERMGLDPSQPPGRVPRELTGAVERLFFALVIAFEVSGAATAMMGWLGVKTAANWGREPPEGQSREDRTRYAFSALLAGLLSMSFALIGGLIASGEMWPDGVNHRSASTLAGRDGALMASDALIIYLIEAALVILFILAIAKEVSLSTRPSTGFDATATRGEQSMNAIYFMYGTSTVIVSLAVQTAEAF